MTKLENASLASNNVLKLYLSHKSLSYSLSDVNPVSGKLPDFIGNIVRLVRVKWSK